MKTQSQPSHVSFASPCFRTGALLLGVLAAFIPQGGISGAEPPVAALEEASTALREGNVTRAEQLLEPLATAETPSVAALRQLAEVRQRQQRTGDAVALLERAVTLEPKNAANHSALGGALARHLPHVSNQMEMGEIAGRMLEAFERAVTLDPEHVPGYVGLARYYSNAPEFAGGSRVRAEQYAEEIRKRVPWLGELELGTIASKFGEPEKATAHFKRADELNPGNAMVKEALARVAAPPASNPAN